MKIIIVGIGKVGYAIAEQMTGENHDLVVIDRNSAVLDHVDSMLDVMCVEGNGASASVLLRAGVREANLIIAVSENDEANLICCLMAKKLGAKHTVARVRNPEYFRDAQILRREIGLDMIIYPEMLAGREIISNIKRSWVRQWIDIHDGELIMVGVKLRESAQILNKPLRDLFDPATPCHVVAVKREDETLIPHGNDCLHLGDIAFFMTTPEYVNYIRDITGKDKYHNPNV